MNDIERAIKNLKSKNNWHEAEISMYSNEISKNAKSRVEYLKNEIFVNSLAIQALEKDNSKKLKEWEGHEQCCVCPSCGKNISKRPYCSLCGQRLDWRDK